MKKMNVGEDESRSPLSQKGITLIALIITIIVMLILVGVTINVALSGGLIEKARTASVQTQKEVDKEMLLSAVVATVDKYGNYHLDQVQEHLPEGEFTYNSTTKVYKSKNGNEFTINETTGKVEEYIAPSTQPQEPDEPQESEGSINYLYAVEIEGPYIVVYEESGVTKAKLYIFDDESGIYEYVGMQGTVTEINDVYSISVNHYSNEQETETEIITFNNANSSKIDLGIEEIDNGYIKDNIFYSETSLLNSVNYEMTLPYDPTTHDGIDSLHTNDFDFTKLSDYNQ